MTHTNEKTVDKCNDALIELTDDLKLRFQREHEFDTRTFHAVLEDGNVELDHALYALRFAMENRGREAVYLARALVAMSRTQRKRLGDWLTSQSRMTDSPLRSRKPAKSSRAPVTQPKRRREKRWYMITRKGESRAADEQWDGCTKLEAFEQYADFNKISSNKYRDYVVEEVKQDDSGDIPGPDIFEGPERLRARFGFGGKR